MCSAFLRMFSVSLATLGIASSSANCRRISASFASRKARAASRPGDCAAAGGVGPLGKASRHVGETLAAGQRALRIALETRHGRSTPELGRAKSGANYVQALGHIERARADKGRLHSEVYFGIGLLETDAGRRSEAANLPNGHPAKPPSAHLDMVSDMRRFISQRTEAGERPSFGRHLDA